MWVSLQQAAVSVFVCKHSILWQNTVVTVVQPSKLLERAVIISRFYVWQTLPSLSTMQLSSGRNDQLILKYVTSEKYTVKN